MLWRGGDRIARYEARQVARMLKWRARQPGRFTRTMERLTRPLVWLCQKLIPQSAVEKVLHGNLWLARRWAHERSALRALGAASFAEVAAMELTRSDRAARKIHRRATYLAGGVGFASGFFGFMAMPVGMAGAINVALRTIRRIAVCYGYAELGELEQLYIYYVLSLAGSHPTEEKEAVLRTLYELQDMIIAASASDVASIAHPRGRTIREEAFIIAHHDFSKEITRQMVQIRLLTAIPVIGAGIGLLVDVNYMRSVGRAARHAYQRRWLRDRGRWPEDMPASGGVRLAG